MKSIYTADLPAQSDVERQLLFVLFLHKRPIEPRALYGPLADHFGLTAFQRNADLAETNENAWRNRVRQARRRLINDGLLDGSVNGLWSLTSAGREQALKIERFNTLTADDLGL